MKTTPEDILKYATEEEKKILEELSFRKGSWPIEKIYIEIETANDIFQEDFKGEVNKILDKIKGQLRPVANEDEDIVITDSNGNLCGSVTFDIDNG